ncbi:MAG: agmatinase [Paracoccaceae bacterium]|jgi:agmatinase
MNVSPPAIPFIGASERSSEAIALLGIPYDKTASFRKGTRLAPDAIREVSDAAIETYSPALKLDLADAHFSDLGDLQFDPDTEPEVVVELLHQATAELLERDTTPVIIGGEHSISPGAIRAAFQKYPDLHVLQLDAHADLRESYEGSKDSHACAMRRVLDFLPSNRLLQCGIRSGTKEEFEEMDRENRLVKIADLATRLPDAPLWITFDIDVFDPSECPGTGTPEAGGLTYRECETFLETLRGRNIIGLDLVEVSPPLDPTGISTVLAAKLLREFLLILGQA